MRRALTVAALALSLAAALQPAEAPAKSQSKSAASPHWKDAELKKAIEQRLARSAIAVDKFKVDVNDGVAHITGKTDVIQHKGVATRLAKAMGARSVKNDVEVSAAAREKAAAQLAGISKTTGK